MEYVNLEGYAARMVDLAGDAHGLRPHRLEAERSKLAREIHRILRPSIRRLAARKNMTRDMQDDIDQHALIAITLAIRTWDPAIATFSTHVHWKVRAELQTLQHFEFPNRRKLAVPHRIHFLELDRPYATADGDTCTMADQLVDDGAEDDVEESARRHIAIHAIERVFSHLIASQMTSFCINAKDDSKIAEKRHGLMRNRWIYIRRTLWLETYEQIAQEYNITRERARQIIRRVEEQLKGQLPRLCTATHAIVSESRDAPKDIHPSWDYMLIDFYMATGEDTRLFGRETPMPTRPDDYDFRPSVLLTENADADEETGIVEEVAAPEDVVVSDNVVKLRPAGMARRLGVAAIAGAMLTSAVAANAQSRAIPPEAAAPTMEVQEAPRKQASVPTVSTRVRTERRSDAITANESILTTKALYGVRVAQFDSEKQAKAKWQEERRSWSWLRGLRPAYTATSANVRHAVSFGPLSEAQAKGMCREAQRISKQCDVVRFGVERQASSPRKDSKA